MNVTVAIVDAFIDGGEGGNPAGVVLDADDLSASQKRAIAAKVGLSETAFVSKSNSADFKLYFFTPQKQIAHCGHATIAAFSLLSQRGLIAGQTTSKETIDGDRQIEVLADFAYMRQTKPKYPHFDFTASDICLSLGVHKNRTMALPAIVNTGNSFLILGVKTIKDLENLRPDYESIKAISDQCDLIGFYVFSLETHNRDSDASTRMFAPRYGIKEESATGMAAGPLACFLHDQMHIDKDIFLIEQGYSMHPASPSLIKIVLSRQKQIIHSLKAGGIGKLSRYEEITI